MALNDYHRFSHEDLRDLTRKELLEQLKSKGCDQVRFTRRALVEPQHRAAVLQHYSFNFMKKVALRALILQYALPECVDDEFDTFLIKLLKKQKNQLTYLEIRENRRLSPKLCRKMNQWMKQKQSSRLVLMGVSSDSRNMQEMFSIRKSGEEIFLQDLWCENITLSEGCFRNLSHLTRLMLTHVTVNDLIWDEICSFIKDSETLKTLKITSTISTDTRGQLFGNAVADSKSIDRLELIHVEETALISVMEQIFQSESLTRFKFRPGEYHLDVKNIFSTLREHLAIAKAPLTSLDFGKISIPDDILALLDMDNSNV